MSTTYQEILKDIETKQQEAQRLRAEAIGRIKSDIALMQITPEELGLAAKTAKRKPVGRKRKDGASGPEPHKGAEG